MFKVGSEEPFIPEELGKVVIAMQWRKPLSISEVTRMAPTSEVLERPGRA